MDNACYGKKGEKKGRKREEKKRKVKPEREMRVRMLLLPLGSRVSSRRGGRGPPSCSPAATGSHPPVPYVIRITCVRVRGTNLSVSHRYQRGVPGRRGARHCDINIPSLSAVNQRRNTHIHPPLRCRSLFVALQLPPAGIFSRFRKEVSIRSEISLAYPFKNILYLFFKY